MLAYVILGVNLLSLCAMYVLFIRQLELEKGSLELDELSRRLNDLPDKDFEHEVSENIGYIAEYLADLDNRLNQVIDSSEALRFGQNAVVEQTNTMLTISEEISGELLTVKEALSDVDERIKTLDEYIDDLNDGNSVIEQGFYATVSSITKLQEAQKVTRDLLDATINSFDWDEDEIPTVNEDSVNEEVENHVVEDLPEPQSLPPVSMDEEPPIVEPRKDGDPMITDLRAVPFEETAGGPDPYALGYTPDVEEWPTDFSSSSNSTSRPRSRNIRRLR